MLVFNPYECGNFILPSNHFVYWFDHLHTAHLHTFVNCLGDGFQLYSTSY